VAKTKEARGTAGALKKSKGSPRSTISSSSPLGMLALHLLEQWRQSGRGGIVFLAENENRAERLGSVLHFARSFARRACVSETVRRVAGRRDRAPGQS